MLCSSLFTQRAGPIRFVLSPSPMKVALSNDHKPDRPGELERIQSCGGFVSPAFDEGHSARVWLDEAMTQIGLVRD